MGAERVGVVSDAELVGSMRKWISDCWLGDDVDLLDDATVVAIVRARYAGGVRGFVADEG